MNNLEVYIRESIFDKSAEKKVQDEIENTALEDLRKYSYENLNSWEQQHSPWKIGEVRVGEKGIEVYMPRKVVEGTTPLFSIERLEKPLPIKISKVVGDMMIEDCSITSLKDIFVDGAVITGELDIAYNDKLRSLSGCPKKVGVFYCEQNKTLPDSAVKDGPKEAYSYCWKQNGNWTGHMSDEELEELIKKHTKIKTTIVLR